MTKGRLTMPLDPYHPNELSADLGSHCSIREKVRFDAKYMHTVLSAAVSKLKTRSSESLFRVATRCDSSRVVGCSFYLMLCRS